MLIDRMLALAPIRLEAVKTSPTPQFRCYWTVSAGYANPHVEHTAVGLSDSPTGAIVAAHRDALDKGWAAF